MWRRKGFWVEKKISDGHISAWWHRFCTQNKNNPSLSYLSLTSHHADRQPNMHKQTHKHTDARTNKTQLHAWFSFIIRASRRTHCTTRSSFTRLWQFSNVLLLACRTREDERLNDSISEEIRKEEKGGKKPTWKNENQNKIKTMGDRHLVYHGTDGVNNGIFCVFSVPAQVFRRETEKRQAVREQTTFEAVFSLKHFTSHRPVFSNG